MMNEYTKWSGIRGEEYHPNILNINQTQRGATVTAKFGNALTHNHNQVCLGSLLHYILQDQ